MKDSYFRYSQAHPGSVASVYATKARDEDPASQIAVNITGTLKTGRDFAIYIYARQADSTWT